MAEISKLISLDHLRSSIRRVREYVDVNFSPLYHEHDEYCLVDHAQASNTINRMTGYTKAAVYGEISEQDTLNSAIGKLERGVENLEAEIPNLASIYLKKTETAAAAYKLNSPITINLAGSVTGSTELDGSEDVTIFTTVVNISSDNITSMKGYTKGESAEVEAVSQTDSLNAAIGKLERALDSKQPIGDYALRLHTHDLVSIYNSGFMSAEDKMKLDDIENNANNYIHPTNSGNRHIPAGGIDGDLLGWAEDGTAQWIASSNFISEDRKVYNELKSTVKAYITGTQYDYTNIGEQVFDSSVYLSENTGELCADTFVGYLNGEASTAAVANKTRGSLTIKLDGASQDAFNGSTNLDIDITPASINAITRDEANKMITDKQATEQEVREILDGFFPPDIG